MLQQVHNKFSYMISLLVGGPPSHFYRGGPHRYALIFFSTDESYTGLKQHESEQMITELSCLSE